MSLTELEAEALKLDSKSRARLAGKLLDSLEYLSEAENEKLWIEEIEEGSQRRDSQMDADPQTK